MEDSLKALRKAYEGEEAIKVYDAFRSHAALHRKNRLLLTLLDDIRQANAEVRWAYRIPHTACRIPHFVWPTATAESPIDAYIRFSHDYMRYLLPRYLTDSVAVLLYSRQ